MESYKKLETLSCDLWVAINFYQDGIPCPTHMRFQILFESAYIDGLNRLRFLTDCETFLSSDTDDEKFNRVMGRFTHHISNGIKQILSGSNILKVGSECRLDTKSYLGKLYILMNNRGQTLRIMGIDPDNTSISIPIDDSSLLLDSRNMIPTMDEYLIGLEKNNQLELF